MSVAYKIRHTTRYDYQVPVSVCQNIVCLAPRPDPRLKIKQTNIKITPQPTVVSERVDSFGNITHAFSIEEPHDALIVEASTDVIVDEPKPIKTPEDPPWERVAEQVANQTDRGWLDAFPFVYDSPLVTRSQSARELAEQAFTIGRGMMEASLALNTLIHSEFEYRPGSTHVGTTSTEAIANRFGVCQDFAHAMTAALRCLGLPARYVSGYLRTVPPPGRPKLIGVDQSHAWVSVYMGDPIGWVDLDPTNNMRCGTDHIPVAIGRDYGDIAPIRGAFLGGGDSRLSVSVDVAVQGTQAPT